MGALRGEFVHRHASKCFELYINFPDSYSPKDNFAKGASGISAEERGEFPFISVLQLNSRHKYFLGARRGAVYSCVGVCWS